MLLLLAAAVFAQTAPIACTSLEASSVCGAPYAGFPVLFANLTSFNDLFFSLVLDPASVASQLGCTAPSAQTLAQSLRYQASMFCSLYVNAAIARGYSNCNTGTLIVIQVLL